MSENSSNIWNKFSIVPRAELPDDMKDNYNFENI